MKPKYLYLSSFVAAVAFHAMFLFGYHLKSVARPLPAAGEPVSVAVNLIDSASGSETVAAVTPDAPPESATPQESTETAAAVTKPVSEPVPLPSAEEPKPSPTPKPVPNNVAEQTPQPAPKQQRLADAKSEATRPAFRGNRPISKGNSRNLASTQSGAAAPAGNHGSGASPLPRYRSNPKPDYPPSALQAHHEGVVLIAVDVSTDGRPTSVNLARSSGFSELDQSAIHTMWRWRFDPARLGGLAVAGRVNIPVRFRINS